MSAAEAGCAGVPQGHLFRQLRAAHGTSLALAAFGIRFEFPPEQNAKE